jgi:hypothetical protein
MGRLMRPARFAIVKELAFLRDVSDNSEFKA